MFRPCGERTVTTKARSYKRRVHFICQSRLAILGTLSFSHFLCISQLLMTMKVDEQAKYIMFQNCPVLTKDDAAPLKCRSHIDNKTVVIEPKRG